MSRYNAAEREVRKAIDGYRDDMYQLRRGGHTLEAKNASLCIESGYAILAVIRDAQSEERERVKTIISARKKRPYSVPSHSRTVTQEDK